MSERLLQIEPAAKLIEAAYLNILSREPTGEELKLANEHLIARQDARQAAVIELVWSLIASAEFRLNH